MENFIAALGEVFILENILGLVLGTLVGIFIGALPGLSTNMGIALMFPVTYAFKGIGGVLMLIGIYCGSVYGGSISALLLNTPGTPSAAATILDGYPMAKKGQPARALGLATVASTLSGLLSVFALIFLAPQLAKVALQFSKPEYFALALFGISIISSVSGKSIIKGVMGGVIGLLIATVGIDGMNGNIRFTFGTTYMLGGIPFLPVLIGLFAFSQVLLSVEELAGEDAKIDSFSLKGIFPSKADIKRCWKVFLISSGIGTIVGAIPGTGADISCFIAYDQAKRMSKHPEEFGKGSPEGIVAPESANNAVTGGAMVPLLSLGIPGDGATAIMLGAFLVQGLTPGPLLFTTQAVKVNAIYLGLFIANVCIMIFGLSLIRAFVKIIQVPKVILLPIIFVISVVGSYAYNNSYIDLIVMVISGCIGYFIKKFEFSNSAIVIGIILGSMAEMNFRGALILGHGSPMIFFTSPICMAFIIISLISMFAPVIGPRISRLFKKRAKT